MPNVSLARKEIHKTLAPCNFCLRRIGVSFIDKHSKWCAILMNVRFILLESSLMLLVACELGHVAGMVRSNASIADIVANMHIIGYGIMGMIKTLIIWSKRLRVRQLIEELAEIWPVAVTDAEEEEIKRSSLNALKIVQIGYVSCNLLGNMLFNITPIALHISRLVQGVSSDLGFIWMAAYPFDKTRPVVHELVFVFEFFSALVSVWGMIGTDVIFTTMASHITMMLRILQIKIKSLAQDQTQERNFGIGKSSHNERNFGIGKSSHNWLQLKCVDCYEDITSVVKIHQRLIKYTSDLEDVFSMVNLTNVVLCAVNICCVAFRIVVSEPWMVVTNKVFLAAVLAQAGIICWYADNIYRASIGVSAAVYESGWYKTDARCRRALLLLLQRSQRPLCFTAYKFRNITMATYNYILTSAYSYFTLLYTIHRD